MLKQATSASVAGRAETPGATGWPMLLCLGLFDSRTGLLPKLSMLAGISYLFLPIDLIPDRLGWVGHLDEAGFLLLGSAGAALSARLQIDTRERGKRALLRGWLVKHLARLLRHAGRLGAVAFGDRFVLRLVLGRWPDALERAAFRQGLVAVSHGLPPLLRAAAYVPAAGPLLSRTMLLNAQRDPQSGLSRTLGAAQMMGDPLTLWRGPKLRFLHLEKTAGSSLINVLTAQFHPLQIDADPDRNTPPPERAPFSTTAMAAQREADLVWGHYDLPSLRRLDGGTPAFTLCVFREPRRRVLSLYYYWRANQEDQAPTVRHARANRLLPFLRSRDPLIRNYIDNLYVRRLTGLYAREDGDPLEAAPERALKAALEAVDTLDYVGLSERLSECLADLGQQLGFAPPTEAPRINVLERSEQNAFLPYRPTPRETVTPEIQAELDRLTALDRVLYRHVEARFERERPRL